MDQQFIQLLVNGIALGSIIALASVGLTLTNGILRLSNFAHGDFMTLGAYLTLVFNLSGLNIWLSMLLGAGLTIGAALLSEKLLWQPMRDRRVSSTTLIIISIGLALFIRNGIILFFGGDNQSYDLPVMPAMNVGGLRIAQNRMLVVGLAIAVILGLHLLLRYTKIGKAMRAVADNVDLARVAGINVEQVVIWTWVISAGLTAVGGGMYGLITAVRPNMGWFLILPMFASIILGGIGNPYGAIAGSLIIGVAQEMSAGLSPILIRTFPGINQMPVVGELLRFFTPEYKLGIALFIMVLVLLFRPQGIFRGTM
jgi:neutral amino acid transport system permease protein